MSKLILAGGAAAGALVIAIVASINLDPAQPDFSPSAGLPSASGNNANLATNDGPAPDSGDGTKDVHEVEADSSGINNDASTTDQSEPRIHFTDENFELLNSSPEEFVNSTADISGRVYELVDQSSSAYVLITYRIHNQAIDSEDSRAVAMFQQVRRASTLPPAVLVDDCISIQGNVRGGLRDTSSLGQPIQIPLIDVESMKEIECIDSAMPALRTISSNLSQSYAGVVITAERVQLTDGHLRIKISAENIEGGDSVFIREKESLADYEGASYPSLNSPAVSVYEIDPVVPAKSKVVGYLFFEPVKDYDGEPIAFRIVVEKVGISESEKSTFILRI